MEGVEISRPLCFLRGRIGMMPMDWGRPVVLGVGDAGRDGNVLPLLGLVLVGLVLLVRWLWGRTGQPRGQDSPLEILKRRYARGEITREEFESIRRDLLA
jgi:putative membrane protein